VARAGCSSARRPASTWASGRRGPGIWRHEARPRRRSLGTGDKLEAVEKLVRGFVVGVCRRRTRGTDAVADQRACRRLARRLVARDPRLAPRLHYVLALDRVGIDTDDSPSYIVANALAVLVMDTFYVLRKLDATGDIEAAREALDRLVKNWSDLMAGAQGAIRNYSDAQTILGPNLPPVGGP
jgi:hypothetical protein